MATTQLSPHYHRSGLYYFIKDQEILAKASKDAYEQVLVKDGYPKITTEIAECKDFHYAEEYHQQYLAKPGSRQYCSAAPTAVPVPSIGI